jgi:excisionase family DNA binding protein
MYTSTQSFYSRIREIIREEVEFSIKKIPSKISSNVEKSKYVTVQEAMEILEVSKTTIYKYFDEGLLHRKPLGRSVRILREEVENLPERLNDENKKG